MVRDPGNSGGAGAQPGRAGLYPVRDGELCIFPEGTALYASSAEGRERASSGARDPDGVDAARPARPLYNRALPKRPRRGDPTTAGRAPRIVDPGDPALGWRPRFAANLDARQRSYADRHG